ncbi:SDR family NAD(P)-dependent oxidoreductase [Rhodococcus sp. WS4]|nr:SDR family NAD(P)-dependent oxidoreductase [Rhodococcus sp. WS4]
MAVISSDAVNVAHPMYSIYEAAKWALEGWCEALEIELAPFGLDVKIIQPGNHDTPFGSNVQPVLPEGSAYTSLTEIALPKMERLGRRARPAERGALEICAALESDSSRLRVRIGNDDKVMASRWAPYAVRRRIVERLTGIAPSAPTSASQPVA